MTSPYAGHDSSGWEAITRHLIEQHPLRPEELVDIVLRAWADIFSSNIGAAGYRIGGQIFPKPQMMGFFLNELIGLELARRYPGVWRGDERADEKDLVCLSNPAFSVELKTSSSDGHIYGNRSYAQEESGRSKKDKSGYYLAVNFQKFTSAGRQPEITLIRFGWLDHEDWQAQRAPTGQQARLDQAVEQYKLLTLYAV